MGNALFNIHPPQADALDAGPQNMWYPNANVPEGTLPHLRLVIPGAAKGKGKGPPLPKAKAGAKKGAKGGRKGGTQEDLRLEDQEERVQEQERNRRHNQASSNPTRGLTTTAKGKAQT